MNKLEQLNKTRRIRLLRMQVPDLIIRNHPKCKDAKLVESKEFNIYHTLPYTNIYRLEASIWYVFYQNNLVYGDDGRYDIETLDSTYDPVRVTWKLFNRPVPSKEFYTHFIADVVIDNMQEINEWIAENLSGSITISGGLYSFENENDAALFMIRWNGELFNN